MIAAVCVWHQHHEAATAEIEVRLGRGERLAVPAPALAETYSVLTRLPSPHRLAPTDAWKLIEVNFIENAQVVALNGSTYVKLLGRSAGQLIGGGRTYDAIIAECAKLAKGSALLTFNSRDFAPPLDAVPVIEPSQDRAR
jgi:predicted nucleic acid-binding protein